MTSATIDGCTVEVADGLTVLQAAAAVGIRIPTLCHHEGLPAYGACRLCSVEISTRGRTRIGSSCTRTLEAGMVIRTDTPDLRTYRRVLAELLLARCPTSQTIQDLAHDLGVQESRFEPSEEECVLCGLCVRACQDAVGVGAIGFLHRGLERRVGPPFFTHPETCTGCGACARVCPTGAISVEDVDGKRYLRYFDRELELDRCPECGRYTATARMRERASEAGSMDERLRPLCTDCRRKERAATARGAMLRRPSLSP